MGNKTATRQDKSSRNFESSLVNGNLRLTATESTNRVSKREHDVVKEAKEISALLSTGDADVCRVLVIGKSGSGKSALINAISGEELAVESHQRYTGTGVVVHKLTMNGKHLMIIESPGLFDGSEREEGHVDDMKSVLKKYVTKIHLVLYCHPMTSSVTEDDREAMKLFTSALSKEIWNKAMLALTFVNKLTLSSGSSDPIAFADAIHYALEDKSFQIKDTLKSLVPGISEDVVTSIPVVPCGFYKGSEGDSDGYILPDSTDWLYELWCKMKSKIDVGLRPVLEEFENERFVPFGFVSVDVKSENLQEHH